MAGAVSKPHLPFSHLVGAVSNCAYAVRLKTAPTGPGENIELPIYFLKLHPTAPVPTRRASSINRDLERLINSKVHYKWHSC